MRKIVTNIVRLFQQTILGWFQDNAGRQAAALAYYGVLSLAPMLIIAISVAGFFFGRRAIQQDVIAEVERMLGTGSAQLVESVLNATYSNGGGTIATAFSLLLLLFASTNIFFQLKTSLNRIWGVEFTEERPLWKNLLQVLQARLTAGLMVVGFGLVLLLTQILNTAISLIISVASDLAVNTSFLLQLLNTAAFIGLSATIISLIFQYLPDQRLAWRDVWVGALFTAVLFALGQGAIGLYLENSSLVSAYGVASSLIVVLLWIYYTAAILLFGAEFTQAFVHEYGSLAETRSP